MWCEAEVEDASQIPSQEGQGPSGPGVGDDRRTHPGWLRDRCRRAVKAYQAFTPWWCEKIRPVRAPGLHSAHNSLRIIGGGVPSRCDFY